MQEVRSLGREDPLEENTATRSPILAWRIPRDRGAWRATVPWVTDTTATDLCVPSCPYVLTFLYKIYFLVSSPEASFSFFKMGLYLCVQAPVLYSFKIVVSTETDHSELLQQASDMLE